MRQAQRQQIGDLIAAHQSQLAAFARSCYHTDGRGFVHVGFPTKPVPLAITMMKYITLGELRRIVPKHNTSGAVLIAMVESYDPAEQAVLSAGIAGQPGLSVKMKLE